MRKKIILILIIAAVAFAGVLFFRTQKFLVKKSEPKSSAEYCTSEMTQQQCWQEQIEGTLRDKGLDAAFTVLSDLYTTQPAFATECHSYAHFLGNSAYAEFSQNKKVELSAKASYCGYGFYHGFMEDLLHTSGNIQEAKDFCAYVGKELASQTTDGEGACYHGIGHGAVDGGDPRSWGDAKAMMAPAFAMCEQVAGDDRTPHGKLYRCVTGAFNAIQILADDSKYKLTEINRDPFSICLKQPPIYKDGCYVNMLPAVMEKNQNDFVASAKEIEKISGPDAAYIKAESTSALFHEYIRLHLNDPEYDIADAVKICHQISADLRPACIEGLSGGHMKYGPPQKEYTQGLKFCSSNILNQNEQQLCYGYILPRLRNWYSVEKSREICDSVPAEERKLCPEL